MYHRVWDLYARHPIRQNTALLDKRNKHLRWTHNSVTLCFVLFLSFPAMLLKWYLICSNVSSSPWLSFCSSLLWPFPAWRGHGLQSAFHPVYRCNAVCWFKQWHSGFTKASSSFIGQGSSSQSQTLKFKMWLTFLFLWNLICNIW